MAVSRPDYKEPQAHYLANILPRFAILGFSPWPARVVYRYEPRPSTTENIAMLKVMRGYRVSKSPAARVALPGCEHPVTPTFILISGAVRIKVSRTR